MFFILLRRSPNWDLLSNFSGTKPQPTSFPTQTPIKSRFFPDLSRSANRGLAFLFEYFIALAIFKCTRRFFLSSYFKRFQSLTKVRSHKTTDFNFTQNRFHLINVICICTFDILLGDVFDNCSSCSRIYGSVL